MKEMFNQALLVVRLIRHSEFNIAVHIFPNVGPKYVMKKQVIIMKKYEYNKFSQIPIILSPTTLSSVMSLRLVE